MFSPLVSHRLLGLLASAVGGGSFFGLELWTQPCGWGLWAFSSLVLPEQVSLPTCLLGFSWLKMVRSWSPHQDWLFLEDRNISHSGLQYTVRISVLGKWQEQNF